MVPPAPFGRAASQPLPPFTFGSQLFPYLDSVRGLYVEVVVGDLRPHPSAAALDQEVDLMTQHASRGPSVQGTGGSGSSAFGLDVTCRGCQEGRLGI